MVRVKGWTLPPAKQSKTISDSLGCGTSANPHYRDTLQPVPKKGEHLCHLNVNSSVQLPSQKKEPHLEYIYLTTLRDTRREGFQFHIIIIIINRWQVLYLTKILIHKDPLHTRAFIFYVNYWRCIQKATKHQWSRKTTEKKKDKKRKLNPPLWIAEWDERTVTYVHDCAIRPMQQQITSTQ